jgi:hypothetical protein
MKVKLDENLPRAASRVVEAFGHDVDTVVDEGLGGKSDARVLRIERPPPPPTLALVITR